MTAWTGAEAIAASLRKRWDSGRLLAERAQFPLELALRQPTVAQMGQQFEQVRAWILELEAGSGAGYEIVWREINHRQLGRNRVPDRVIVPTFDAAVRLIGKQGAVRQFDRLAALTLGRFPALSEWVERRALLMIERAVEWERVLACLQWFVDHPRSGLYLRQLDIPGVDSKFIEARKPLLAELLDVLMPAVSDARQFEARYGLRAKPATIRFRILDPAYALCGLTDVSVPVEQFAALRIGVERVFVTENEINALAFPDAPSALLIFGGGYAIDRLADVEWLKQRDVVYWGDIDTHGFAILDRLRASMPHARSMLMDMATLHAHHILWGQEDADKRYLGELARLSADETALFDSLRSDAIAPRLRLEQERISYRWLKSALRIG